MRIKLYTFQDENAWETVETHWNSPFFFWTRRGVRVTPPVPLRVKVLGSVIEESDEGWINIGGASSVLLHVVQARGKRGETVRFEFGQEITEDEDQQDDAR